VQHPLDNIYKLSKIATRASKEDNLVWVMQLMYDMWSSGAFQDDQSISSQSGISHQWARASSTCWCFQRG
jgi:hypothetical protein